MRLCINCILLHDACHVKLQVRPHQTKQNWHEIATDEFHTSKNPFSSQNVRVAGLHAI